VATNVDRRGDHGHDVRRLRDLLRSNVMLGAYPDGLLPSEGELMGTHRVTRGTVREALQLLRQEGLIERTQGVGTFSVSRASVAELAAAHGGPDIANFVAEQRPRILDRSVIAAPDTVGRRLGVPAGSPCLRLEYVALLNDEPVALATNYAISPEAEALRVTPFRADWYTLMAEAGVSFGESEFVMGVTKADATTGPLLGLDPGQPVHSIEQVIRDADGRPFDLAFIVIPGDRLLFLSRAIWRDVEPLNPSGEVI
jgi:GntR family transcriptional regulator